MLTTSTMIDQVIDDRYRVHSLIGRGQMGVVFAAVDEDIGAEVALKFLLIRGDRKSAVRRFFRGARLARTVRHKYIVRTLDFGLSNLPDRAPFLVMDRVHGMPLTSFMDGRLSVAARVGLVVQVLQALAHMHARNVLHRDIKPENILVERGENGLLSSRVTDFGIASDIDLNVNESLGDSARQLVGTPSYMAPERASQIGAAKPSSDLYSVGSMLYEMLAGNCPFVGSPIDVLVKKNRHEAPPILATPSVPDGLISVVMKLLEREPTRRYQHAIDVLQALLPFAEVPYAHTMPMGSQDVLAPTLDGSDADAMATVVDALESPGSSSNASNPFLWGRSELLDQLDICIEALDGGHGQIVMLEGPMGMGLDDIMEHMAVRVAETGRCQVLRGDFTDFAGGDIGLRHALEGFLGSHGLKRAELATLVSAHLDQHGSNTEFEHTALLQFLRPTRADTGLIHGNQNAVFALFFRALRRISAERPIFLALASLHRGHALSAAFIEYARFELSFSPFPIVLCTTREIGGPDDHSDNALALALNRIQETDPRLLSTLVVEPIETDILAEGLRGQYAVDSVAAYGIAEHAGGSPLLAIHLTENFVAQTRRQLKRGDSASGTDSWARALQDGRLTLTPALSDILTRNIDAKLRHPEWREPMRQLVEAMAILGSPVEYQLLASVAEGDFPSELLDPLLMELGRLGILISEGSHDQEQFRLHPPLLRDYYLEHLPDHRREHLHRRAILAYCELWPDGGGGHAGILGDHYAGVGDEESAIGLWLEAFQFQFDHGDPLNAAHWGLKVIRAAGSEDIRSVECALTTGRMLLDVGELERAASILSPLQSHRDTDVVMRAGEVLSDVFENQGDSAAWKGLKVHLDHCLGAASPVGQRAYLRMRSIFENSYGRARSGLADAIRALENAPPGEEAQRAAQRAVFCCLAMGTPRSGLPFAEKALSESRDNPQLRVRSLRALGTVFTWLGRGQDAVSAHQEALDIAHRYGLYARIPIAYHDLGDAHRMNDDGLAASQAYDVALYNASQLDLGHTRELVRVKQVMCRLTDGDTAGVVDELQSLAPIALRSGLGLAVPFCRLLEAWSWCIDQDWQRCLSSLKLIDDLKVIAVDPQIPQIIEFIAHALQGRADAVDIARLYSVAADLWKRQEDLESAQRCRTVCDGLMDMSD